jgi:hypothetical protein
MKNIYNIITIKGMIIMNYNKRNERDYKEPATYEAIIGKKDHRGIILTPVELIKANGTKKAFRKDNHTWITNNDNKPLAGLTKGTKIQFDACEYNYQKLGGKWNKGLGKLDNIRVI